MSMSRNFASQAVGFRDDRFHFFERELRSLRIIALRHARRPSRKS